MKRLVLAASFAVLIAPSLFARTRNVSIWSDDDTVVTNCNQIVVRFDNDSRGFRTEESLPVSGAKSLKVSAARNGGVYVHGGNGYAVTLCKVAESESTLSDIRANLSGGEVSADGPDERNWVGFFLVTVPRNGSITVDSHNGPISFREVNGTINAEAINGPIAVRDSSGNVDIHTQNGPIALDGGSGTVKLRATNGPIAVNLRDTTWNGTLDARTQNGPLAVKLPPDFRSGTVIDLDGRGPVSCHAEVCRQSRRSWDDDEPRRIEFGSGPTIVHMSTTNGPVSVKED